MEKFDLVIIGAGGAGLPAAITAAEKGITHVLVLEKRVKPGGNAAMAWGIFAAESPLQKEHMVDARKEVFFKKIMDWAHWKVDPSILRAYIWKSGETIAWLEEKGLKFDLVRYFPGQEAPVWHVPEGHGARMVEVLTKLCEKQGVQVRLKTSCKNILLDDSGNVKGVMAEHDGREFVIQTRSVIIASGGYAGNRELLRKYCDYYDDNVHCFGIPHSGDGLQMAVEIGAATASLGLLLVEWPHVKGDNDSILATLSREPYTVYINKAGKRFIDEEKGFHAFECANAIIRQPEKTGYILADETIINHLEEKGALQGRGNNRAERRRGIPGLREKIRSIAGKNPANLMVSDSWAEIARWIGIDPAKLQSQIDEYNGYCDHGYDAEFFKDRRFLWPLRQAPYYAMKGELVFLQTMGGIKVNEKMEVLNSRGQPIGGLYAAGADTGGWEPETYCDKFSGTAFGFAVNSGRIAAENAARFIKG